MVNDQLRNALTALVAALNAEQEQAQAPAQTHGDVPSVAVDTLDMRLDARAGGLVLGAHGADLLIVRGSVDQLRSAVERGMGMAIPAGM